MAKGATHPRAYRGMNVCEVWGPGACDTCQREPVPIAIIASASGAERRWKTAFHVPQDGQVPGPSNGVIAEDAVTVMNPWPVVTSG